MSLPDGRTLYGEERIAVNIMEPAGDEEAQAEISLSAVDQEGMVTVFVRMPARALLDSEWSADFAVGRDPGDPPVCQALLYDENEEVLETAEGGHMAVTRDGLKLRGEAETTPDSLDLTFSGDLDVHCLVVTASDDKGTVRHDDPTFSRRFCQDYASLSDGG
jgi:hypothetical protein